MVTVAEEFRPLCHGGACFHGSLSRNLSHSHTAANGFLWARDMRGLVSGGRGILVAFTPTMIAPCTSPFRWLLQETRSLGLEPDAACTWCCSTMTWPAPKAIKHHSGDTAGLWGSCGSDIGEGTDGEERGDW